MLGLPGQIVTNRILYENNSQVQENLFMTPLLLHGSCGDDLPVGNPVAARCVARDSVGHDSMDGGMVLMMNLAVLMLKLPPDLTFCDDPLPCACFVLLFSMACVCVDAWHVPC
jgi:hypothetical protein